MARQKEIVVGRRDVFAVKVAFLQDPDDGRASFPESSLSWGGLEIWVNGHNLCEHVELGEPIQAVHWYLLPFLQWLAGNWDFLLHEERLPGKNAANDAWVSMLRTDEPPPRLTEDDSESWEVAWHSWWQRHCLLACRDGGLFPNLFIRRWRDLIEISWGDRPLAGAPDHFRFNAYHGYARLGPDIVASVLFSVLEDAARHLRSELPRNPVLDELVKDVERLKTTDRGRRLGLLSGLDHGDERTGDCWEVVQSFFPENAAADVLDALFGADASNLVVNGASPAALMFGSVSPRVEIEDARLLAGKLVDYCRAGSEKLALRQLVRDVSLEDSEEYAWHQGYRLALDFHEEAGGKSCNGVVDVDAIFQNLDIAIDEVRLNDRSIRAVAIAGTQFRPVVLHNINFEFLDIETRRFTLAHELCHVLHDRGYGAQLAMASGPWAPLDIERRANAFAAMFLMPQEALSDAVRRLDEPLETPAGIWRLAHRFQTSFTSTLEHLCNLGFISEVARDSLRVSAAPRTSP